MRRPEARIAGRGAALEGNALDRRDDHHSLYRIRIQRIANHHASLGPVVRVPHALNLGDNRAGAGELLEGEVLFLQGSLDEALAAGQRVFGRESPHWKDLRRRTKLNNYLVYYFDLIARIYTEKGDVGQAIQEYERLFKLSISGAPTFLIHPLYHYRLGILYEKAGNTVKAIENYEKFLDLWKDADPGIAEVDDARERLAGLKGQ